MSEAAIGRRAVVIGAGIGGLAVAQALADHFEQVVVLERDSLSRGAMPRSGTPQARHAHGLLGGGLQALGALFPGFEQDLAEAGAVPLRVGIDLRHERPGFDPSVPRDLGLVVYAMSRSLIERVLRRRLERRANVRLRQRCRVLGLQANASGTAMAAVRYETIDGKRASMPADLILDASGRGAPSLALLQSIGRPVPGETAIGIDLGYATATFVRDDGALPDCKGVATFPTAPESSRSGILVPIEGGQWLVTLGGYRDERPPGDGEGFLDHARRLRTPTIYDAIKGARRIGKVTRIGFPASVWRRFDPVRGLPRGLVPIGDAICRFNPVYGQGMTVAVQEACLLARLLRVRAGTADPLSGLGQAFLAEAEAVIETPWAMSAVADFVFPETRGQRPAGFERTLRFQAALHRVAARDPAVLKLIIEVQNLLKPQSAIHGDPELTRRVTAEMEALACAAPGAAAIGLHAAAAASQKQPAMG